MDDAVTMKLDAIKITEKRVPRTSSLNAIKLLEQKLRTFFNEADGHGTLIRKPPENMFTQQYFKTVRKLSKCSIIGMDWLSFMTTTKIKKTLSSSNNAVKINKPNSILNSMGLNKKK